MTAVQDRLNYSLHWMALPIPTTPRYLQQLEITTPFKSKLEVTHPQPTYFDGYIAELIYYDIVLNDAENRVVENYYAEKIWYLNWS